MQLHLFLASVFKASNENGHVTSESSSVPSPTMPLLTFSSRAQQEQLRASEIIDRNSPSNMPCVVGEQWQLWIRRASGELKVEGDVMGSIK
jgi:hypothetical protein